MIKLEIPLCDKDNCEEKAGVTNYVIFVHYSGPGSIIDGVTYIGKEKQKFNIDK